MITKKRCERITSQKKIILDFLKKTKSHPNAKVVWEEVRPKLPQISLATVYRILDSFKERGDVQELLIEGKSSRYDGNPNFHAHFICTECQQIFDISGFCQECKILKQKTAKVGKINKYQVTFYGICRGCQGKRRKNEGNN